MGRYNKIKTYYNGSWRTPNRIRVYNNGWQDLGTNDSYNTKTMKVRNGNSFVRCTLNRQDTTSVTDRWANGSFSILPAAGYCFCPILYGTNYGAPWYFRCTMRKTAAVDQNIFYCGNGTSYLQIIWRSDGKVQVSVNYGGYNYTLVSNNSVSINTDVYLNVYANVLSNVIYIEFNGITTSGSNSNYISFLDGRATNVVGDTYMQFRNNLSAAGCSYDTDYRYSVNFNTSYASGTDNSQYTGVTHKETTTTETTWV